MMRKVLDILGLSLLIGSALWLLNALPAHAATYTVPALTGASIQSTINTAYAAGSNNTVLLPAGLYNVTTPINVPCNNGLTVTGPVVANFATPTAKMYASFYNNYIFGLSGCTGVSIQDLYFNGAGAIYVGGGNNSGISLLNNMVGNVTAPVGGSALEENGIELAGTLSNTLNSGTPATVNNVDSNILIQYNTVGDVNSCPQEYPGGANVAEQLQEGTCAGIETDVGTLLNFTLENNFVYHMSEGIHLNNLRTGFNPPQTQSYCISCVIEYNFVQSFHRIAYEIQFTTPYNALNFNHNASLDPIDAYFGTLTWSLPCCVTGYESGSTPTFSPTAIEDDNVQVTSTTSNGAPPYGTEFWGSTIGEHELIEGNSVGNGYMWGYSKGPWYVTSDYVCGTNMASLVWLYGAYTGGSKGQTFVTNEEAQDNPPTESNDSFVANCSAQTSVAPTISPAPGSYTSPPTVTLTVPINTANIVDGENTSVYYTTDGSTPVPGSGTTKLYTGTFSITLPTTVKAVGMWGEAPEPLTWPSGYGYVPSAVQSASYTATGGVTLSSVALNNLGAIHALSAGASVQMSAYCTYSNAVTTNCTTTDTYGNSVSTWASSNSAALSVNSSGVATGVAAGTANISAVIASLTTPAWAMAVSSATLALNSVALSTTGGISSLVAGAVNQLLTTCTYADSSTTNCATTDAHGNVVNPWTSSAPSSATVSSSGVVTGVAGGGTNLTATVNPSMVSTQWGQSVYTTPEMTFAGNINATYMVLGSQAGGYSGSGATCSFYLPAGTLTVGSLYDCGLILAPTPTTQGTAWQCYWTYTVTSTSSPGAFVSGTMSSCGTLAAGSAWWVAVDTNQPGSSPAGFNNCGGSCNGSAPTVGNGTYAYRTVPVAYGTRSGMPTTMSSTGTCCQAAQFVTLGQPLIISNTVPLTVTAAAPTLVSVAVNSAGSVNTMTVGGTLQFSAFCTYSDSSTTNCSVADIHGNAVTLWSTSDATKVTIGAVGSASPGLATAIAAGAPTIEANVGSMVSATFPLTISNPPPPTLIGLSLATTGGVTGLFVGSTNQLKATCTYSDSSTTNCTSTDIYGNVAGGYASSASSHATVNATTGLVTGAAAGTTNLTAHAGSFTSPSLAVTVLAVPTGVYSITITGPVTFRGSVRF